MATITKEQLEKLFRKVDEKLERSVDLYVIGGAAAILGYNVVKETEDVDLDSGVDGEFHEIFRQAAHETGTDVELSHRGIFTPPEGYRDRMKFLDYPHRKLRVWTLDKYDLALSKIARGFGKDYEDIIRVHKASPLDYEALLRIFKTEFVNVAVIGDQRVVMMNFLDLVDKLFGDMKMEETKTKIGF